MSCSRPVNTLALQYEEEDLQALFVEADSERTGKLNKADFMVFLHQKVMSRDPEEDIMNAFMTLDRNGDGLITREELAVINSQIEDPFSDEVLESMIAFANTAGNGAVTYKEFRAMILGSADPNDRSPGSLPSILN